MKFLLFINIGLCLAQTQIQICFNELHFCSDVGDFLSDPDPYLRFYYFNGVQYEHILSTNYGLDTHLVIYEPDEYCYTFNSSSVQTKIILIDSDTFTNDDLVCTLYATLNQNETLTKINCTAYGCDDNYVEYSVTLTTLPPTTTTSPPTTTTSATTTDSTTTTLSTTTNTPTSAPIDNSRGGITPATTSKSHKLSINSLLFLYPIFGFIM